MQVNCAPNCQPTQRIEKPSLAALSLSAKIALAIAGLISTALVALGTAGAVLFNPLAGLTLTLVGIVSLVMLFIVARTAEKSSVLPQRQPSSRVIDGCACSNCWLSKRCEEGSLSKSDTSSIGLYQCTYGTINECANNRATCPSVVIQMPEDCCMTSNCTCSNCTALKQCEEGRWGYQCTYEIINECANGQPVCPSDTCYIINET